MILRRRHLLAALAAAAAVTAAGCGSDDEPKGKGIPRAAVSELEQRLDEIDRRFSFARDNGNPGACVDIERDSFRAIETILADLPDDVDPDLRGAVNESFDRLRELTAEGCADVQPQDTQTETVPPDTEPETITEQAPPPDTPTETAPPETTTTPPGPGDQPGNGNGGTPPGEGGGGGAPAPENGDGG